MSRGLSSTQATSWQFHLDAWQSSGQTQAAYCRKHNLAYCQFTYWKQKFAQGLNSEQGDSRSGFVPVQRINDPSSSLTICLPNGASIEGVGEDNCQLARDLAKALL